jgi:hypothetical protein
MDEQTDSPGIGVKLIALLLMFGGIYGALFGLYNEWQTLTTAGVPLAALTGLFVLLFGWSTWIGFEMWHGEAWAFKWAKVIIAAQIPNFTVPGFSFDGFYTGLRILFAISQQPPNLRFGFNLSSSLHVTLSAQVDYWLFGVNLLAVAALIHLMHVTSHTAPAKDKFGLI